MGMIRSFDRCSLERNILCENEIGIEIEFRETLRYASLQFHDSLSSGERETPGINSVIVNNCEVRRSSY